MATAKKATKNKKGKMISHAEMNAKAAGMDKKAQMKGC